ncbi:MAG: hypothetical protein ACYC3X_29610 [Pirellulaceae bacterium]
MTLFWGSADGSKPCFTITSEQGRGVGKTTLVNMLARLVGEISRMIADSIVSGGSGDRREDNR